MRHGNGGMLRPWDWRIARKAEAFTQAGGSERAKITETDEKMNVVGHQTIPPR